jgi:hypothetical protein
VHRAALFKPNTERVNVRDAIDVIPAHKAHTAAILLVLRHSNTTNLYMQLILRVSDPTFLSASIGRLMFSAWKFCIVVVDLSLVDLYHRVC